MAQISKPRIADLITNLTIKKVPWHFQDAYCRIWAMPHDERRGPVFSQDKCLIATIYHLKLKSAYDKVNKGGRYAEN